MYLQVEVTSYLGVDKTDPEEAAGSTGRADVKNPGKADKDGPEESLTGTSQVHKCCFIDPAAMHDVPVSAFVT